MTHNVRHHPSRTGAWRAFDLRQTLSHHCSPWGRYAHECDARVVCSMFEPTPQLAAALEDQLTYKQWQTTYPGFQLGLMRLHPQATSTDQILFCLMLNPVNPAIFPGARCFPSWSRAADPEVVSRRPGRSSLYQSEGPDLSGHDTWTRGFPQMGDPQNGWFIMEIPNKKRMITRGTKFRKPPYTLMLMVMRNPVSSSHTHILVCLSRPGRGLWSRPRSASFTKAGCIALCQHRLSIFEKSCIFSIF